LRSKWWYGWKFVDALDTIYSQEESVVCFDRSRVVWCCVLWMARRNAGPIEAVGLLNPVEGMILGSVVVLPMRGLFLNDQGHLF
jgi:hypothetical protein